MERNFHKWVSYGPHSNPAISAMGIVHPILPTPSPPPPPLSPLSLNECFPLVSAASAAHHPQIRVAGHSPQLSRQRDGALIKAKQVLLVDLSLYVYCKLWQLRYETYKGQEKILFHVTETLTCCRDAKQLSYAQL